MQDQNTYFSSSDALVWMWFGASHFQTFLGQVVSTLGWNVERSLRQLSCPRNIPVRSGRDQVLPGQVNIMIRDTHEAGSPSQCQPLGQHCLRVLDIHNMLRGRKSKSLRHCVDSRQVPHLLHDIRVEWWLSSVDRDRYCSLDCLANVFSFTRVFPGTEGRMRDTYPWVSMSVFL